MGFFVVRKYYLLVFYWFENWFENWFGSVISKILVVFKWGFFVKNGFSKSLLI